MYISQEETTRYKMPLLVFLFGKKKLDGWFDDKGILNEVFIKKLFGKEHIYKTVKHERLG